MYQTVLEGARQRGVTLPPAVVDSDVEVVDELPVSCEQGEITGWRFYAWHVTAGYREHMTKVQCACGGVYASLKQELFLKETYEGDLAYDRVQSKCQRCGQKATLVFDVTQLMAKFRDQNG